MDSATINCILCDLSANYQTKGPLNQQFIYHCKNCGQFLATDRFVGMGHQDNYYLLSGYVRGENDRGKYPQLTTENYQNFLNSPIVPKFLLDKADKLLMFYYKQTEYFSQPLKRLLHPAICFAKNENELLALYDLLEKQNYLVLTIHAGPRASPNRYVFLTDKGISRCDSVLKQKIIESRNAFVAMWFGNDMKTIYNEAIAPAVSECGFMPFRVDNKEHNNDITDEIIAGIRESRFIIADLTGYRGGVYYEAGFAHGLGLNVIFTCRKDWFDGEMDETGKVTKEKIHFDINHQNIIVWENKDELKSRIINRLKATII